MKINTIKWRIFKYNIIIVLLLITLTAVIFNIAVRLYIERDIVNQLHSIASSTEDTALRNGPDFFKMPPPDHIDDNQDENDFLRYYFMLDRSLREPLSVLNANFILLDNNKMIVSPFSEDSTIHPAELLNEITNIINKTSTLHNENSITLKISNKQYIAIIKPVYHKNTFGLGWVVIYSSLEKVNQLQNVINIILLVILILSSFIILIFSSLLSKKISAPFSSLNQYIRSIAERNFANKINLQVDDELQELVNNINIMSNKLETHDQAQKTFLQNASHELRTPLTSIQSYAEGIKYDIVESNTAADIIIDESKRLTHLVEDLLYLSRLDTIEENYHFSSLDFNELLKSCVARMNGIAIKNNIQINLQTLDESVEINADEEKFSRAITNILSNCIRYAKSNVSINYKLLDDAKIELSIYDDGSGFDKNELPNIFERFYKGKNGNHGLGLAISKNVIEKHNGTINAQNAECGALFIIILPKAE